jgi:hypothetical protein
MTAVDANLHRRRVMAALLLATAGLFVIGVVVERGGEHHAERTAHTEITEHREGPDGEAAGHSETGVYKEARVLGIDGESSPVVVLVALVSIALAALLWRSESPVLLAIVAILAAGFAVFDVAELFHQLDDSRGGLALTATLIAAGHAAIAVLGTTAILQARHAHNVNVSYRMRATPIALMVESVGELRSRAQTATAAVGWLVGVAAVAAHRVASAENQVGPGD